MTLAHDTATTDLDFRFAFDGALGDVLRRHVLDDMQRARLSAKFRAYYTLRPFIPIALRQILQRSRNGAMDVDEHWYLQSAFLDQWQAALDEELASDSDARVIHPWPDDFDYVVSLTHDVETSVGCGLVDGLAKLEEEHGFRSCWNFIPYKYKIDDGLITDLKERGHEVAIHGYNHDGRLFTSAGTFARRAKKINDAIARYGADGFRAPMVHRNLSWLQQLDIDYDASCFDVDPFQAMPGGVGGVWPFIVGKFVELPYTLPQDHTLLIALGETTPRIWIEKLRVIENLDGMAMLITHPDYLDVPSRLNVYRQLLEHLREQKNFWSALPREIASWWRERDTSRVVEDDQPSASIDGPAAARGRCLPLADILRTSRDNVDVGSSPAS